jgi:hypothetical protein
MNAQKPDPWQQSVLERLDDISDSLKLMATTSALSALYTSEEIKALPRCLIALRTAHTQTIDDLNATPPKGTFEAVKQHSDELKRFRHEHPHIDVLADFLSTQLR